MSLLGNYFKNKKSKKGMTLVEVVCSVIVLAIVFVGVLNAVAFSRQMVLTNNAREKASFKGQLVADEIFSLATGYDPDTKVDELKAALNSAITAEDDPQNDTDGTGIGKVELVDVLSSPSDDSIKEKSEDGSYIQYTVVPVGKDAASSQEVEVDGIKCIDTVEIGWDITVRVFYRQIGGQSDFRCVDIPVFAPLNYIKDE